MISSNLFVESLDRLFGQALLPLILSSVIHCEIFACSLKKVLLRTCLEKLFRRSDYSVLPLCAVPSR